MSKDKVQVAAQIYPVNGVINVDYRYGPYESIAEAVEFLGPDNLDCIKAGLKFGIKETDGTVTDYVFLEDNGGADKVRKVLHIDEATTENAGLMSAQDKAALSAVQAKAQENADDIDALEQDMAEANTGIQQNASAIQTNASDIASANTTIAQILAANAELRTTVNGLVGISNDNFMGIFQTANDLPTMTAPGWALVGTSLSSLLLYTYTDVNGVWTKYSDDTYDFTDYSGLVTQVAQIGSEIDDIKVELGMQDATFDLNAAANWHSGSINTSTGEESSSTLYIITDKFILNETAKNLSVTNTNDRNANTVVYAWDSSGNYLGFNAGTNAARFSNILTSYPTAYIFAIRLVGSSTSIINTDAIWDDIDLLAYRTDTRTRLDAIEASISEQSIQIAANTDAIAELDDVSDIVSDVIEERTFTGKNIYNGTALQGYINGSGVIVSNTSGKYYYSSKIEVEPNTYYYLYGRTLTSSYCIVIELSDGTVTKVLAAATGEERSLDYYLPKENNNGAQANGQFLTPPNAKYVYFNLYFSTEVASDTSYNDHIMIVRIGTTYNSSYDVGEYEAYTTTTKNMVKSDSLPIVDNLVEGGRESLLSAEQGKVLANMIDNVSGNKSIKILLIGSSHGANTIGQFPFLAYNSGINVLCGNYYRGSITLSMVADLCVDDYQIPDGSYRKFTNGTWVWTRKTTFAALLTDEDWDYIALQRSAGEDMTWTAEQAEDLETIISYISAKCTNAPHIVFNSGFADTYSAATIASQQADTEVIWSTAMQVKSDFGLDIIPMAKVLQNCRNNETLAALGSSENHMLSMDTQHLDTGIGMYVSACVCFDFFLKHMGKEVTACHYLPTWTDMESFYFGTEENFTPIQEQYARLIRKEVSKWFANN